jgi:hypothetical protein
MRKESTPIAGICTRTGADVVNGAGAADEGAPLAVETVGAGAVRESLEHPAAARTSPRMTTAARAATPVTAPERVGRGRLLLARC